MEQIFSSDPHLARTNATKSWIQTLIILLVFFLILKFLLPQSNNTILITMGVMILLKISDSLLNYKVKSIILSPENQSISFEFKSLFQGIKTSQYSIKEITIELVRIPKTQEIKELLIFLPGKKMYKITNKYGYSDEKMEGINRAILLEKNK